MPKLTYKCPQCEKPLVLMETFTLGGEQLHQYKCGHSFVKPIHKTDHSQLIFTNTDGTKNARDYQKTGVEFIVDSGYNCIIADQMRLGKTPQSLLALKNNLETSKDKLPCLIIVKSANIWQWVREFKTWVTILPNGIFPIVSGSKSWIPPGFSAYIISMDTFSRAAVQTSLREIPFKLIIADEAHSFKNTDSNRAQALVEFVKYLNTGEEPLTINFECNRCGQKWKETGKRTYDKRHTVQKIHKSSRCPDCFASCYIEQQVQENQSNKACGLILLTGTPILNRADEYFVPLNLVAPEKFTSLEGFRRNWLEQDTKGNWSRVKPYRIEEFKTTIAPYVLRREKEDVYKDLPIINRTFTLIEPTKDTFTKAYNSLLDKMEVKLAEKANPSFWDMAEDLMELRRICGMMKIAWTSDYLEACLIDNNTEKYAVGIHHKSVRDILAMKMGEQNCMKLSGEDSAERKDWIMQHFQSAAARILIINMLAGGVGMDFHYINNILILERQWNSPIEEQFEFRFYNPDKSIKTDPTNIEYIIAKGTIDNVWFDMVEEKRRIFGETVANHWKLESDTTSFRQLLEQTLQGRL